MGSSPEPVGTPVQTKNYAGVFQPNNTAQSSGVASGGGYQYARTPLLEAGQVGCAFAYAKLHIDSARK